jgi:hypothetical protein
VVLTVYTVTHLLKPEVINEDTYELGGLKVSGIHDSSFARTIELTVINGTSFPSVVVGSSLTREEYHIMSTVLNNLCGIYETNRLANTYRLSKNAAKELEQASADGWTMTYDFTTGWKAIKQANTHKD